MGNVKIYEFENNIKVFYTGKMVSLPEDYKNSVESYWDSLMKSGKKFFRGDCFTVTSTAYDYGNMDITVDLTDYAHFLYTINRDAYSGYDSRVIYTSVLVETCDKKFVLGEMNKDTSSPGKLQLTGGGIDKDDINGNMIDLEHNIKKEIFEELYLDTNDKSYIKSFRPYLLKSGGKTNFLSAIFKLELLIDGAELLNRFNNCREKLASQGINPEFSTLIFLNTDRESIEEFTANDKRQKDENLIPVLKAAAGMYPIYNIALMK